MEETILQCLMINDEYFEKSFTHLDTELFNNPENSVIFDTIKEYVKDNNTKPSLKEIGLTIKENPKLKSNLKISTLDKFKEIAKDNKIENVNFILSKTEKWVQKQKLTASVFKAADIIKMDEPFEPIVNMFEESLKVSFDNSIGMDYNKSMQERIDYYNRKIKGIPTHIKSIDEALGGGYMKKTLSIVSSSSHGGKCVSAATKMGIYMPKNIVEKMIKAGYEVKRKN